LFVIVTLVPAACAFKSTGIQAKMPKIIITMGRRFDLAK
jgi:hypothetical protein